jgi:sulfotransferase
MKTIHFISGLPRSGSTLLVSILNQNPRFYSNTESSLARLVKAIINEECPDDKKIIILKSLIDTYYYDIDSPIYFNTNSIWTLLLDVLDIISPDSKVICCVRDIIWILDSFEVLFRKNPFISSQFYNGNESETVYTRCNSLMSSNHILRFSYDGLKEAITGNHRNKLILIEYDYLAKFPDQVLKSIYNFIDEPYFEHDFNNVIFEGVRKKVEFIERPMILPPDIRQAFSNLEVWR